jgi:hypothetical protein
MSLFENKKDFLKIFTLSILYSVISFETASFNFIINRIKIYHVLFFFVLIFFLLNIKKIKLQIYEYFTLYLFFFSLFISSVFSLYFTKTLLWSGNILLIIFGLLGAGFLIKPSTTQLFTGIVYGAIPSTFIGYHEYFLKPTLLQKESVILTPLSRIYGTAYEPGYYALILFFASIPILKFFLEIRLQNFKLYEFNKVTLLFSALSFFMVILSTGRSAWISVAVFFLLFTLYQTNFKKILILFTVITISFIVLKNNTKLHSAFTEYLQRSLSVDDRVIGFQQGVNIFLEYPLLGCGLGCFGQAIFFYQPYYWLDYFIYYTKMRDHQSLLWELTTYNFFLEQLVHFGIFGIIWLLCAFFCLFKRCQSTLHNGSLILITTISGLSALLFNQNIFRAYILFLPLIFMGSFWRGSQK